MSKTNKSSTNSKLTTKIPWLLIGWLIVIAFGVGSRFFKLGSIPVSLYWDEAAILLDAKVVAATGFDIHHQPWFQLIYPSYGDYKLPVYIWLTTVAVKLVGVNQLAVRLPSALAGVATIGVGWLLAQQLLIQSRFSELARRLISLAVGLVITTAPWSIIFSRTGFEGHLAQLWFGLSIWALLKSKDNWGWSILGAILGGLATYTYFSVRFVWPEVAGIVAVSWSSWAESSQLFQSQKSKNFEYQLGFWLKSLGLKLVLPLTIYGLLLIPMTRADLYAASNQFRYSADSILNAHDYALAANQLRAEAGNQLIDRLVFHRHWLLIKEFGQNLADHLSLNYLFLTGDANLRHGTGHHGLFLWVLLPFLLVGFYQLYRYRPQWLVILGVWWLAALIPAAVPETTPHALRSLNALLPISLILGVGLGTIGEWLLTRPRRLYRWGWAAILGSIFLTAVSFSYHYLTQYPVDSAAAWQAGYQPLAEKILELRDTYQVNRVYVMPFDHRFFLWLLLEPNLSAHQIQELDKPGFQVEQINNIYLNHDWSRLSPNSERYLVVSQDQTLTDLEIDPNQFQVLEEQTFEPPFSQHHYQFWVLTEV